jgi:peptidoglycan/xylan/chitin deacetylase (PgdA/CDA1 family)
MWPDGARCAVSFTFDFDAEEVWIGEDPANAGRPGVLSQGTYGAKVGVPSILEILARRGVRATFFVPGRVAERHPDRVAAIAAAGHEIAHHGYTHTSPTALSPEAEEKELLKGLAALRVFGTEVIGYRSPSWEVTPHTLRLLAEHGFGYSSSFMDDIKPYRHPGGLAELPIQWTLDDAPYFWFSTADWTRTIATTDHVRSIWTAEFLGIREMGGACVLTMHPQIMGRPGRLAFLDSFIDFVTSHGDVWVATAAEIATRA